MVKNKSIQVVITCYLWYVRATFDNKEFGMAKLAFVRARIEPELKENAEHILKKLGIKLSDAINMIYLNFCSITTTAPQSGRQSGITVTMVVGRGVENG